MTEPTPLSYAQLYDAMRALYLGKRHHIEICEGAKGYAGRAPEWFIEQRGRLRAIQQTGELLRTIAAHGESFDAWLATVTPKEVA